MKSFIFREWKKSFFSAVFSSHNFEAKIFMREKSNDAERGIYCCELKQKSERKNQSLARVKKFSSR